MPDITNIIPPRVPLVDERTGLISREWYRFFFNQFTKIGQSGASLEDLQVSPVSNGTENIIEVEKNVEGLLTAPRQELGTMAALQQANLPWVTFDNTPEHLPSNVAGTLFWDNVEGDKTLALVMEGGLVTQQIGLEQYYRIKADAAITEGQVIMFTGAVGASGALRGAPATGLTAGTALYVMGVATEDIANNGWGYVTAFGTVRGINTTGGAEAWVDGQLLYLNPAVAGGLTKNLPTAPNPKVVVAAVTRAANNGSMLVRPAFGGKLGDFEGDTQVTSPVSGDLLQYNGTIWQNVAASTVIAGAGGVPVTKTADFTVAVGETWLINNKSGSTCTVTLPAAATYPGRTLTFHNYQNQLLVSASSNVVPRAGGAAGTAILAAVAGDWATLVSNGTNWVIMQAAANNCLLTE